MNSNYTNLPPVVNRNTIDQKAFVNFYVSPLEVDSQTLDVVTGFFTSRGFDISAAASFASVILAQAKKDNTNPLTIIDTLKGYDNLQLNSLVAEITNYNRYKTSFLGFGPIFNANPEIARNVLP